MGSCTGHAQAAGTARPKLEKLSTSPIQREQQTGNAAGLTQSLMQPGRLGRPTQYQREST